VGFLLVLIGGVLIILALSLMWMESLPFGMVLLYVYIPMFAGLVLLVLGIILPQSKARNPN
jgi:hypothetical protein